MQGFVKIRSYLKNRVLQNILIVGSITFLVKLVGFVKESYIASVFGLSEFLDTYALAILIPALI
ncbi:MAG: virulence factor MviN, partial [Allomuricauda sp.]